MIRLSKKMPRNNQSERSKVNDVRQNLNQSHDKFLLHRTSYSIITFSSFPALLSSSAKHMSVDELSLSFASSIGIDHIKEEYLARNNNLYTDLDQLEKSVDAEFEQYMNQARSFPFHEQASFREHPDLKDTSVHSDYEILGADLLDQVNDELNLEDVSWQRYLKSNDVDEKYNVKPLRNNNSQTARKEEEKSRGREEDVDYSSRNTSPGEYFGARSLPLNSMDNVWQQHKISNQSYQSHQTHHSLQSQYSRQSRAESNAYSFRSQNPKEKKIKTETEKLLDSRFKTLPRSLGLFPKYELPEIELHHPYTQKQSKNKSRSIASSSISSTQQQCASRDLQLHLQSQKSSTRASSNGIRSLSDNSFHRSTISSHQQQSSDRKEQIDDHYTIEPSSPLHFLCEISPKTIYAKVVYLKITNKSSDRHKSFAIYSSKNLLEFEMNEGTILEHETIDIKIKIQSSALSLYKHQQVVDDYPSLYDKILVLMDGRFVNELDVNIDFIGLEEEDEDVEEQEEKKQQQQQLKSNGRPKCRYCALEEGYLLHCLQ